MIGIADLQVRFLGVLLRLWIVVGGWVLRLAAATHHEAAPGQKSGCVTVTRVFDEAPDWYKVLKNFKFFTFHLKLFLLGLNLQ